MEGGWLELMFITTTTTKNKFLNRINILVTKGDQYAAKVTKKCFQR